MRDIKNYTFNTLLEIPCGLESLNKHKALTLLVQRFDQEFKGNLTFTFDWLEEMQFKRKIL